MVNLWFKQITQYINRFGTVGFALTVKKKQNTSPTFKSAEQKDTWTSMQLTSTRFSVFKLKLYIFYLFYGKKIKKVCQQNLKGMFFWKGI